jgi:hypothetical protein
MKRSTVWEILEEFKRMCNLRGWSTSQSEDWIKTGDKYHNFLWTRDIPLSSFKKIVSNRKCIVPEGSSYRVEEASYTAWLFSQKPSEDLVKTVYDNSDFSERTAIYDLTLVLKGEKVCAKLNNTSSPVFQEFERFLKEELKVKFKSVSLLSSAETDGNTIKQPA